MRSERPAAMIVLRPLRFVVLAWALLLGWFSSAPAVANEPNDEIVPVTVLQLQGNGIAAETAKTISELFSVELSKIPGLRVTNDEDIRRMLDVEAQKQSVGCDESSCLLEIAAALGTRYVVWGSIGKLGNLVVVTVNLFDSDAQGSVRRESAQAEGLEKAPQVLGPLAKRLVAPLLPRRPPVAVFASSGSAEDEQDRNEAPASVITTQSDAPTPPPATNAGPRKPWNERKDLLACGSLALGASSFSLGYCGGILDTLATYPDEPELVPLAFLPFAGPPLVAVAGDATGSACSAGCLALGCQVAGCVGILSGAALLLWANEDDDRRSALHLPAIGDGGLANPLDSQGLESAENEYVSNGSPVAGTPRAQPRARLAERMAF